MRIGQIVVALVCIVFGGFTLLMSAAMTLAMLISRDAGTGHLIRVVLFALAISSPIVVAGIRLLLNRPHRTGGLFSPNTLRALAVVNGVLGGAILLLAIGKRAPHGIYGGISFLVTTQGAFILANRRAAA